MLKRIFYAPVFWGCLLLILAQVITFVIVPHEKSYVEVNQFPSPQAGLHIPIIYFFAAVVVLGLVLFLIPVSKLRLILTFLFTFIYVWGLFILFSLFFPVYVSLPVSIIIGITWFFIPKVWLQNILLLLSLVSVGLVFGYILAPWAALLFLIIIAVYDFVSVKLGYMMWMAQKLSESDVLPAFVIPGNLRNWNLNLKKAGFKKLFEATGVKEYSILGGGDIGFPLLVTVSVFFIYGFTAAIIISIFSIIGLIGAYIAQAFLFKGKPTPALPTIALACIIGFLIVRFVL